MSARLQQRILWSTLAVATVVATVVFVQRCDLRRQPPWIAVLQAYEELPTRASEARISMDARYKQAPFVKQADLSNGKWNLFALITELQKRPSHDFADDHAVGVARLLAGNPVGALYTFQRALRRAEAAQAPAADAAALWNDLAVAHYELGKRGDRVHFVIALDCAERAARLAQSPEAAWTRAITLARLNLHEAAMEAWKRYLEIDTTTQWAAEARDRLAAQTETREVRRFEPKELTDACQRNDTTAAKSIVAMFPKESRLLGEDELLGEWAAASFAGGTNEESTLHTLRALAGAVQATTGESLLADVVGAIDATAGDAARHHATAEAILQYREGRNAYKRSKIDVAERKLWDGEQKLRALGNPLAVLAGEYRAASIYSLNRYADVAAAIGHDDFASDRSRRYFAAHGLRGWIAGLALVQTGRPAQAADSYQDSLAAFREAGETESVASVLNLRAEALDSMTATDEAWADRMGALAMFGDRAIGSRPLMWMGIATAAVRDHYDYAADVILREIGDDARRRHDSMWSTEAAMLRTVTRTRIGDPFTDGELDAIRRSAAEIENRSIRERAEAHFQFVTAEIMTAHAAPGDLDHALAFYRRSNDRFNGTVALATQARARAMAADFTSADASLVAALTELERQAREIPDPVMRTMFAERARTVLLLASDLELEREHAAAGLWLSDRARQVALRTFAKEQILLIGPASMSAEDLGKALVHNVPPHVVVVHQDLQSDRLLTWVIRDGALRFVSTRTSAASLMVRIDDFRVALSGSHRPDILQHAKGIYDVLLGPVRSELAGAELLVYSPPPALRGLPIAALYDGQRFVVERQPVVVTRSLATFIEGYRHASRRTSGPVLVALPDPNAGSVPLVGARREVSAIAALYGSNATLLAGRDATLTALLAVAPEFDVIHIATHGRGDRRPLQNAIEFGADRLRAYDVLSLRLSRSPVVVLSGCRTDDEMEGRTTLSLAASFISAGASAVVGSVWDVEDISTERLMTSFHQQLSNGVAVAEAFRRAQMAAIERSETSYTWSAFQLQM